MANHKSSIKRARQNEKRHDRNRWWRGRIRTAIKKVVLASENKETEGIDALLQNAVTLLGKSYNKGIYKKNNVARRISRLTLMVNKVKAA